MTASPWATYVNDPLGYRTSETSGSVTTTYTWDVLQRMTGRTASTNSTYEYRVDGMRTYKSVGTSVSGYTNTLTRHDATMPFELETLKPDGTVTATREALGARGVDAEESVTGTWTGTTRTLGSSTIAYPLYDAHGNRACTLSRYGSGSWTTDSPRFADAWGTMRTGSATGGSPMRYCASLGHLQDDESGLVYMRGRYYEPASGRFISEDIAMEGQNWYIYTHNDPTNMVDRGGATATLSWVLMGIGAALIALCMWGLQPGSGEYDTVNKISRISAGVVTQIAGLALLAFTAAAFVESGDGRSFRGLEGWGLALSGFVITAGLLLEAAKIGARTNASIAIFASTCYGFRLLAELVNMDIEAANDNG